MYVYCESVYVYYYEAGGEADVSGWRWMLAMRPPRSSPFLRVIHDPLGWKLSVPAEGQADRMIVDVNLAGLVRSLLLLLLMLLLMFVFEVEKFASC